MMPGSTGGVVGDSDRKDGLWERFYLPAFRWLRRLFTR
jgi:hypothetical protein